MPKLRVLGGCSGISWGRADLPEKFAGTLLGRARHQNRCFKNKTVGLPCTAVGLYKSDELIINRIITTLWPIIHTVDLRTI